RGQSDDPRPYHDDLGPLHPATLFPVATLRALREPWPSTAKAADCNTSSGVGVVAPAPGTTPTNIAVDTTALRQNGRGEGQSLDSGCNCDSRSDLRRRARRGRVAHRRVRVR